MTNECIPYFEGAYTQKITVHAAYALTGKKFVGPLTTYQNQGPGLDTDPLQANAGGVLIAAAAPSAGGLTSGVAAWDVAINGKGVIIRGAGTVLPCTSGAAVNAGDRLKVDTQGRVVTATATAGGSAPANSVVGIAHSTVAGADLDVIVELLAPYQY